jgi:hypothetical protein
MPQEDNIRAALQDLRTELENIAVVDSPAGNRAQRLKEDIDVELGRETGFEQEDHDSLGERLREEIAAFEAEHPEVVRRIDATLQAIANTGV